jgi:hypothetical protein
MVSKLEMLGLRERADVGVDGMEDTEEKERLYVKSEGNDSLNFVAEKRGEWAAEVGALVGMVKGIEDTWCRGDAGRRRRGKVLLWDKDRDGTSPPIVKEGERYSVGRGVMSSSWSSSMLSISETADEALYASSDETLNGLRTRFGERRGLDERPAGAKLNWGDVNAGEE